MALLRSVSRVRAPLIACTRKDLLPGFPAQCRPTLGSIQPGPVRLHCRQQRVSCSTISTTAHHAHVLETSTKSALLCLPSRIKHWHVYTSTVCLWRIHPVSHTLCD